MWAPYAWFRIADCEWQMARWLNLGVERYQQADKALKDYLSVYPDGSNAAEAKARVVEVHRREAEKYRQIAEFYITAEQRPWAAVELPELPHQRLWGHAAGRVGPPGAGAHRRSPRRTAVGPPPAAQDVRRGPCPGRRVGA